MRSVRPFQVTIAIPLILVCLAELGIAGDSYDLLFGPESSKYSLFCTASVLCATILVECVVAYAFLRWPQEATAQLFCWILVFNVITIPVAPLLNPFLRDFASVQFGKLRFMLTLELELVLEFIVVLVEWGLMTWIFSRMHRCGVIRELVTPKRALLIVLTANVSSFILGVLMLPSLINIYRFFLL